MSDPACSRPLRQLVSWGTGGPLVDATGIRMGLIFLESDVLLVFTQFTAAAASSMFLVVLDLVLVSSVAEE